MLVLEKFLSAVEVQSYRQRLPEARWQDGLVSAGGRNALAKRNKQTDPSCARVQALANELTSRMGHHAMLVSACLPHKIFPPVFNSYQMDEAYDAHVDAAVMQITGTTDVMRSDVSMTLFLSRPDEYDGGELVIETQFGAQEVRLDAGDAVIYPSGSLHRVNPVSRGQRLAAITWIQSMVPDTESRTLLFELDQSIQSLSDPGHEQDEVLRLTSVYHNLVRRMAQI